LRKQKFSLGQRVMMLRPKKEVVHPRFFLYQMLSPLIQDDQIAPLCKGSASPHLNIGALRNFGFLLPSLLEQRRVVAELDALEVKVHQLKALQAEAKVELGALLPSILHTAFRGELRAF
jgi:type I restriction enzyme S subunit